jgi:Arc/MetJ-type ribon-helix-helix transcriptional regulator
MPVQISSNQERVVRELMSSGDYANEEQVIDDALKALKARNQLRNALQVGLDELDRGEGISADIVFRELRERATAFEKAV